MENKSTNILRDLLLVILSVIISISGIIVANNFGLINLKNSKTTETTAVKTDLTQAIATARACSVSIFCDRNTTQGTCGSGVILNYDAQSNTAYVITNHHVINEVSEHGYEILPTGYSTADIRNATLIGSDPENDIAILAFSPKTTVYGTPGVAEIGRGLDELSVGEDVVAVGNPYGFYDTVTSGIVSKIGRYLDMNGLYKFYIQTNAEINGGNSGGGLFDSNGKLIGINTMSANGADGISFSFTVRFDKTILNSNTVYNVQKRDAITSYNCLMKSHNELVDARVENTVGYIANQTTIGATFDEYSVSKTDAIVYYVYIDNLYETNAYTYLDITNSGSAWSEPTSSTSSTSFDSIVKVEYSTTGASGSWQTANYMGTNLARPYDSTSFFYASDLVSFLNLLSVGNYVRFTVNTCTINDSSLTENNLSSKTIITKVCNFKYCVPVD